MSNGPFDTLSSLWRKTERTSVEADAVTNAAGVTLDFDDDEQVFAVPARLFEQTAVCRLRL